MIIANNTPLQVDCVLAFPGQASLAERVADVQKHTHNQTNQVPVHSNRLSCEVGQRSMGGIGALNSLYLVQHGICYEQGREILGHSHCLQCQICSNAL
jgi:hypothetical protein